MNTGTLICIQSTKKSVLSKTQSIFNNKIKTVEKLRSQLKNWQAMNLSIHKKQTQLLEPIRKTLLEKKIKFCFLLDEIYTNPAYKLNKNQKELLHELLSRLTNTIKIEGGGVCIDPLFECYGRKKFHEDAAELSAGIASMAKSMWGIDLDLGDDFVSSEDSFEDVFGRLHEKMKESSEKVKTEKSKSEKPRDKKTARQMEKESAEQKIQEQSSQTVREVYRKLASALHPDRCLDENEREKKSELMVRVNQAYEKNDILELLSIQLEIEQINAEHIQNLSEERLQHFNLVLREQEFELSSELHFLKNMLHDKVDWPEYRAKAHSPKTLLKAVSWQVNDCKMQIEEIETDTVALSNPKTRKIWFKKMMEEIEIQNEFDVMFS